MYTTMSITYLSSFAYLVLNFCLVQGQGIKVCQTYPADVKGICVPVQDCPRLKVTLERAKAGQTDAITTLRRSVCSLTPPSLCCEPVDRDPNEPVLPPDCGEGKLEDFIVGGEDAGWWPWMVVFRGTYTQGRFEGIETYFCGGTLINDRFILTAAHCMVPQIKIDYARLGELIISTDPDSYKGRNAPPVQNIPVADAIIHPQYKTNCHTCNDIAIVRLLHPAKIQLGFSSPICLPQHPKQEMGLSVSEFQGQTAKAAGWGTSNLYEPNRQPDHLQQVNLPIATRQFCQQITTRHPINSTICAGLGDRKDTCKGDSGGPLMLTNEIGTRYFLVGITSFGPRACGSTGTQGVYTNVHHYVPWILQNIS